MDFTLSDTKELLLIHGGPTVRSVGFSQSIPPVDFLQMTW